MPVAESIHYASLSEQLSFSLARTSVLPSVHVENNHGSVTAAERQARWGHRGAVLELSGPAALLDAIERSLLTVGVAVVRVDADGSEFAFDPQLLNAVLALQTRAGLLTLLVRTEQGSALTAHATDQSILLDASQPDFAPASAVAAVHRLLYEAKILISPELQKEGSGI
jgi:hypothetical protein